MPPLGIIDQDLSNQVDSWFATRGFPFLARPGDSTTNLSHLSNVLGVIILLEAALLGIQPGRSVIHNILTILSGPVVLFVIFAFVGNLSAKPQWLDRLLLVVVPALPALVYQRTPSLFVLIVVVNYALILGITFWFSRMKIVPLLRWALGETLGQIPRLLGVVVLALPVLFVALIILFFTAEIWQTAHRLDASLMFVAATALLLVALTVQVANLNRLARNYCDVASEPDWPAIDAGMQKLAEQFPQLEAILAFAVPQNERVTAPPPLPRLPHRVKNNVFLLLLFAHNLQLAVICLSLGSFLLFFGAVSLPLETQASFVGAADVSDLSRIFSTELMGHELVVTSSLVKVTLFLVAITYLSFVLHAASVDDYAPQFLPHIELRVQEAVIVKQFCRSIYWRPLIKSESKSHCTLRFVIPVAVKASEAILVWKQLESGATDSAVMTPSDRG